MKKLLLLSFALVTSGGLYAQNGTTGKLYKKIDKNFADEMPPLNSSVPYHATNGNLNKKANNAVQYSALGSVSAINIGKAGNAFGTAFGAKTNIWADPRIKTVGFIHRSVVAPQANADGTVGHLRYDVSKNNGNNWTNMVGPVYSPDGDPIGPNFSVARYPQAIIYNPSGNTDPDNAFLSYFAPSRDGSNPTSGGGDWGGHAFGSHKLSNTMAPTQRQVSSVAGTAYQIAIAQAMTVTQQGKVFHVDFSVPGATGGKYNDTIVLSVGTFNATTNDIDYDRKLIPNPVSRDVDGDPIIAGAYSIAFGPDGMTGYIACIGHTSWTFMPDSAYYPFLLKTTDGGDTWTGPLNVDLNLAGVGNHLETDAPFTTGFDIDLVVDANNNPHMVLCASSLSAQQGFAILSGAGNFGVFDIYSTDGGTTFGSQLLDFPQSFRGRFGVSGDQANPEVTEDNRPQASVSFDGTKLFFGWMDTDSLITSDNTSPNLMMIGYDLTSNSYGNVFNVTGNVPEAAEAARFVCMSHYVLDSASTYTVPVVIVQFKDEDISQTGEVVQFQYLKGITFSAPDFISSVPSIASNRDAFKVSNYPNPFNGITTISVAVKKETELSLSVSNTLGQQLMQINAGRVAAGTANIQLDGSALAPGIYFYTVNAGSESVTKKLIVN